MSNEVVFLKATVFVVLEDTTVFHRILEEFEVTLIVSPSPSHKGLVIVLVWLTNVKVGN